MTHTSYTGCNCNTIHIATPNSVILSHSTPDSGGFVIILVRPITGYNPTYICLSLHFQAGCCEVVWISEWGMWNSVGFAGKCRVTSHHEPFSRFWSNIIEPLCTCLCESSRLKENVISEFPPCHELSLSESLPAFSESIILIAEYARQILLWSGSPVW